DDVEHRAWEAIQTIDSLGGSVRAIERGYIQREIEEAAYRYQREIETHQRIIVGVNQFTSTTSIRPSVLRVDPVFESQQ
ncbi:methylmalonyl-CoA mutase family protein, partial [Streptomyces sp. C-3]